MRERTPEVHSGSRLGVVGAGEVQLQPGPPDLRLVSAGEPKASAGFTLCVLVNIRREEEVQEAALRG